MYDFLGALTLASLWAPRTLVAQVNLLLRAYLGRGCCRLQGGFSAARFDYPALPRRREGCTITSEELPAGSLLPGVCFGHHHVSNPKRLSPPLAQSSLGRVIQSSSVGPAVTHMGTALSGVPGGKPFSSLLPEVLFHATWSPFWVKNPNTHRDRWTEHFPHHCSPCHPPHLQLQESWGMLGLNSAEDGSAAFSRAFPPTLVSA